MQAVFRRIVWGLIVAATATAVATTSGAADRPLQQPATTVPQSVGTRLILLGTEGGPRISKFRAQPASLLIVNGEPYLIDAGDGTESQLALAGLKPGDLGKIFITHLHIDHTAGLASLIALSWSNLKGQNIDIYGPPGTAEMVRRGISYFDLPGAIYSAEVPPHPSMTDMTKVHEFDIENSTVVYQDKNVRVTAVENTHYATINMPSPSYGPLRSYSYRFDTPTRSIVFTGDTGPSSAVEKLAKGADILVSEVISIPSVMGMIRDIGSKDSIPPEGLKHIIAHMETEHMQPDEVGMLAAAAGVKMVILNHLSSGKDESDITQFTDGVRKYYKGPVIAGRDLDEF